MIALVPGLGVVAAGVCSALAFVKGNHDLALAWATAAVWAASSLLNALRAERAS